MIIYMSLMMIPRLNDISLWVHSIFHKVAVEVNDMGSNNILHV